MTDSENTDPASERNGLDANALLSRLKVIEDQQLESRAVAFAQIHDELQGRLDSGDSAGGA
ncbi:MAG TPA: hypothetical protein VGF80_01375 [Galbitalea sp.]